MSRVWKRTTSPPDAVGAGIQAPPQPRTAATNSPRREDVTYADAVGGERSQSFITEALKTPSSPPPQQSSSDDEGGWADVHFKRHRMQRSEENRKQSPPQGLPVPPYIVTPLDRLRRSTPESTNLQEKQEEKDQKMKAKRKIEHLHASLALDSDMVAGKEEMETCTVATMTKIKEGFVTARKLSEALKESLEGNWDWPVKEFRDGRFMITCKSPEEAREIERSGELHFPAFTIKCAPWSADIWKVDLSRREIRWPDVRDYQPLFRM
ncbi:hypothetical protein J5N97_026301 [Dioscorea zingiberensis]|uniref:Uncharacterized protein n=1 Tax=Dioscorea zingiberensis TaxID=325984 RepID=A0A9D5H6L0_9LILI|nr:hypothetical protein J5N97_026301 [Dioscorea zingiberensis]